MKIKFHNRKFYGKWIYKITLEVSSGAGYLRNLSIIDHIYRFTPAQKQELMDLACYLSSFPKDLVQFRTEHKTVDVYTNSKDIRDAIAKDCSYIVKHSYEVASEVKDSQAGNLIYVKKLPHDAYEFKVYLKPHTFKGDSQAKQDYLDWIDTQGSKIKISEKVREWFIHTDWNWDRRYMYVENEPTLLMISMRNSSAIGTVYRHVIVDK